MIKFNLKEKENGNVEYIYSAGDDRFGKSEMPLAKATAICAKARDTKNLSKATELIADGFNIKVTDADSVKYFFGNVIIKSDK